MGKELLLRFLRGGLASAIASMILIIPSQNGSLSDIYVWLNALSIAGIVGFITGGLLALDKYFRTTPKTSKKK